MEKKLYRTVIQLEVLSEEPLTDDFCHDLQGINYEITQGEMSGLVSTILLNEEKLGLEAVKECNNHGTSTDFFMMDENGEELN